MSAAETTPASKQPDPASAQRVRRQRYWRTEVKRLERVLAERRRRLESVDADHEHDRARRERKVERAQQKLADAKARLG